MTLPESGLYLSSTRAYNPGVGRWLRRDMAGEAGDADANLYGYGNGDPINLVDPNGEAASPTLQGAALGGMIGLGTTWWDGVRDGDYTFCEFGQTIRAGIIGAGIDGATGAGFAVALKGSARIIGYLGNVTEKVAQTGAIKTIAYWDFDAAEAAYASIRGSNNDIIQIASNTGIKDFHISRVKDHLFSATHRLDGGVVSRFDAHPEIANAWNRLSSGTHTARDVQLLRHELFESKFEGIFRTNYRTAHDAANRSGRYSGIE